MKKPWVFLCVIAFLLGSTGLAHASLIGTVAIPFTVVLLGIGLVGLVGFRLVFK